MHKRGLCRHAVSVCLSRSWIMWKRINIGYLFSPSGSYTILVFQYQTGWRYSDGNPLNGGVECRWCIDTNRDSGLIAAWLSKITGRAKCQNIYRRRSWVYDTVGHASLAVDRLLDVRTTKWQKQLPTTMQCRSHSRRRTSECLFVTACSMDEYAEEKRTEKDLIIVRSGISEAETTNSKRLRSTFCIEAIYRHEASRGLFATAELLLIILSLLQTEINCDKVYPTIYHHTLNLLVHYLVKWNTKSLPDTLRHYDIVKQHRRSQ